MELKRSDEINVHGLGLTFNRTFMELKQAFYMSNKVDYSTFNRTFMELKP